MDELRPSETVCDLSAAEQRVQFNMSVQDFYRAGKFFLEESIVHMTRHTEATDSPFHMHHSWEDTEAVVKNNIRIEAMIEKWDGIYAAVESRMEKLEDISFLLSLMDDEYIEIRELYMESIELLEAPPRLDYVAQAYAVKCLAAPLDDEDNLQNIMPGNLEKFQASKFDVEGQLDWLYNVVFFGSDDGNTELVLKLAIENVTETIEYTIELMLSRYELEL